MTSNGLGGVESDCDLSVRNVDFCSLERPASNSEMAQPRRSSAFKCEAFARTLDIIAAKSVSCSRKSSWLGNP
jgi:hypothetical protein